LDCPHWTNSLAARRRHDGIDRILDAKASRPAQALDYLGAICAQDRHFQ